MGSHTTIYFFNIYSKCGNLFGFEYYLDLNTKEHFFFHNFLTCTKFYIP